MVSLSYSSSAPSSHDPIFVRTHFLGRVAADGLGLDYQHELLKRRSSRHSDLHRWDTNWLAPVAHTMSYDSDDTSDTTDDDGLDAHIQDRTEPTHHLRSRSSTLPFTVTSSAPFELARARSMTAPSTTASTFESPSLRKIRPTTNAETRLLPARPLTIDTVQPLRLASVNVSALAADSTLSANVPSPIAAADPSAKMTGQSVVRIECSESDGSCHGDAGDQDPEAQLAAGIIRLREQRRGTAAKTQRRVGSKRRSQAQTTRSPSKPQLNSSEDLDSDDAQSLIIRKHGGSFVLRLAEVVLDFGSSALEKLMLSERDDVSSRTTIEAQQSPLQPRRRSSTTPKELSAEAGELLRRRRERVGSLLPPDSVSESTSSSKASLTRSWSVPKLLSLPLLNPSASLRALSSSTASSPATPTSAPTFGFTSAVQMPSKYKEISSFDDVGACFSRQRVSLYTHSSGVADIVPEHGQVSPLWKQ